jgi:hypothetical protein
VIIINVAWGNDYFYLTIPLNMESGLGRTLKNFSGIERKNVSNKINNSVYGHYALSRGTGDSGKFKGGT